jgi:hypothetical protein
MSTRSRDYYFIHYMNPSVVRIPRFFAAQGGFGLVRAAGFPAPRNLNNPPDRLEKSPEEIKSLGNQKSKPPETQQQRGFRRLVPSQRRS